MNVCLVIFSSDFTFSALMLLVERQKGHVLSKFQWLILQKTAWPGCTGKFGLANKNKAVVVMRLCPGAVHQWMSMLLVWHGNYKDVMSSTKPEVHDILYCRQRRTEPQWLIYKRHAGARQHAQNISWSWDMCFLKYVSRQICTNMWMKKSGSS